MNIYHKPVLINEVLQYLAPQPGGHYVDVTFGSGGHTSAILDAEPTCKVTAIDWDKNAIEINGPALEQKYGDRLQLLWGSFSHLTQILKKANIKQIDGIVADFGTSQYQITNQAGFSFNVETPLDMRMSSGHHKITAYDIVNRASEEELSKIFYDYGQEFSSRKIAKAIVIYRRENGPIKTTKQLADVITTIIPKFSRKVHPATKVFQALRIVVNDELNNIKSLLTQLPNILAEHGRIVCISFHSLEDRIVKQFFKTHSQIFKVLTDGIVTASPEELALNPSSRSAKLRAAEKVNNLSDNS